MKTKYGQRTFDFVGSRLWNALPLHVRNENKKIFKTQVKTILFKDAEEFKRTAFKYVPNMFQLLLLLLLLLLLTNYNSARGIRRINTSVQGLG